MFRSASDLAVTLVFALALACVSTASVEAKTPRNSAAKRDFRALHPCPATGHTTGKCPGYVIDHVTPLCAGGADHPKNMQWQTTKEAKIKDKEERRLCSQKARR